MKKLSLLIFAIMILGCGTETPVVEEPESPTEGLNEDLAEIQTVADQLSQAAESLALSPPTITARSVADGATNVDPAPLNRDGIRITFSERIALSHFHIHREAGYSLDWQTEWHPEGRTVYLTPTDQCDRLETGITYVIDFVVQDFGSQKTEDTITFTTTGHEWPAAPAVDIDTPHIESVNMWKWLDADNRVDPEPVNQHGITIVFDEDVTESHFDLTLIAPNRDHQLRRPISLGWIAEWNDPRTVTLIPPPYACSMLQKGATYYLAIGLVDAACYGIHSKGFRFSTQEE